MSDSEKTTKESVQAEVISEQNTNTHSTSEKAASAEDVEKNKTIAALAYLIFFLPLLISPDSKFGKFHANQALLLFLFGFGSQIILGMIPILGWILMPFALIGWFVLLAIGLINGFNGEMKRLPLIGKWNIIK